jgi:hypothetical protein
MWGCSIISEHIGRCEGYGYVAARYEFEIEAIQHNFLYCCLVFIPNDIQGACCYIISKRYSRLILKRSICDQVFGLLASFCVHFSWKKVEACVRE